MLEGEGDGAMIAGLFASWGYREEQCTTISVLTTHAHGRGEAHEPPTELVGRKDRTVFTAPANGEGHILSYQPKEIAIVCEADYREFAGMFW